MKDIKTKETKKNIKVLDKTGNLAKAVRNTTIRAKNNTQNLADDAQITPSEYAEDKVKYMAEDGIEDAGKLAKKSTKNAYKGGRKLYENIHQRQQIRNTVKNTERATEQTAKTLERSIKIQKRSVKTAQQVSRTTIKTAKQTAKTAEQTAKASKKAAEIAAKTAQKAAQAAKEAAAAAYKGAVAAAKATVAAIKAISAGIAKLVAAIAAGGWVAVIIVIVICLIGLIAGSCFGIFFSGEDNGTGMSMQTAIADINNEYQQKIDGIKNNTTYDVLEMSGSRAVWSDVLAVYAVKTASDPNNPQEVATMDQNKLQLLKVIFWEMNSISQRTARRTERVINETDDGRGNIIEMTEQKTRTYLYITVVHKTVNEMATRYGFNATQKEQLGELLSGDKQKIWSQVLYGMTGNNDDIVQMALSQIGNVGGEPYWRWYGFNSRVEWCACFVSWCANQCGYIDNGIIPKYSRCINAVQWFKDRNQWADNTVTPEPGMIIFFDWKDEHDGLADHTGIVKKVENGKIYTVEGNTNDSCAERQYSIGYYEILGYGIPAY